MTVRRGHVPQAALGLFVIAAGIVVHGLKNPIIQHSVDPHSVKECGDPVFTCEIRKNLSNSQVWWTHNGSIVTQNPDFSFRNESGNITDTWKLEILCAQFSHTGNYTCNVKTADSPKTFQKSVFFQVTVPLQIVKVLGVRGKIGARLQLNCTVKGYPLPHAITWKKNNTILESNSNVNISERVKGTTELNSYLVIHNLTKELLGRYTCKADNDVDYVQADTDVSDQGPPKPNNINANQQSPTSLQLTWKNPQALEGIPIHSYKIIKQHEDQPVEEEILDLNQSNSFFSPSFFQPSFRWVNLEEGKTYSFQISACSPYFGCGELSDNIEITMVGYASPPLNVAMSCHYDNISTGSYIQVLWDSPKDSKEGITDYLVKLVGSAHYLNSRGVFISEEEIPIEEITKKNLLKKHVAANTNYTVQVCTMNRIGCGNFSELTQNTTCSTPPSVPQELPFFELKKAEASDDCMKLKLGMKRVSERLGPIMCYSVVLYKMKHRHQDIPTPRNIDLSSYEEVHKEGNYGAYVAEAFDSNEFREEVMLGDESQSRCHDLSLGRLRRNIVSEEVIIDDIVYDGELSPDTYYSGFVEVRVLGKDETILTKRSNLFLPIKTGSPRSNLHATALGVICGLLVVIIILTVALCALGKRNNFVGLDRDRHSGFSQILCGFLSGSRRAGLIGTPVLPPPDTRPLKPGDLPAAFIERHKDSDLLFQREFESLPEQFRDRTTRASDNIENFFKNRYPDIKAYDQTRVKLSQIDGIAGSDYINANFVMGYKDRKKFICAQGPLDKTVNDFWRMIWEHKVEIIIMVTGIEENGKMKCAKYWPDQDEKKYGNITVTTGECNTYAEFAIRRFTICHKKCSNQTRNSRMDFMDNVQQMISFFKRDEGNQETREILHFHYLMWKDFLAPEHPGGILKFLKRINETFTPDKSPLLVHCSAGVGRTGTLVVIDSLLQQMKEEGQLEIFNFVVNIRHQRNYLVQSLKQYIFIYRALMEFAQFGFTEIEAKNLRTHWKQLKEIPDKNGKSLLQLEYEKLSKVIEDMKTTDVGTMDVNMNKNRYESIIPYDRNRVIITPVPSREHSTYINASFIQVELEDTQFVNKTIRKRHKKIEAKQGYERIASFIITQDPLECTVGEFWRMVHEQSIPTIVMLSELGESQDKCLQYWPDDERDCDHINIKKNGASENCSHFTKTEFIVTNTRSEKSHTVVHFHFKWFGELNDIPDDTNGIIDLFKNVQDNQEQSEFNGPVVVHCSGGTDRSSVYVTASIIIQQLQNEKRVDVFQTARNLRSQRQQMLQNLPLYEFCYRVALDYADSLDNDD